MSNTRLRVGVLMGGASPEREESLKSGLAVSKNLDPRRYEVIPIEIRRDGTWKQRDGHCRPGGSLDGDPGILIRERIDVVFIALHGAGGEDGAIQGLLEIYGLPYTGSGISASAVGMNKSFAKALFRQARLNTPDGVSVSKDENLTDSFMKDLVRRFGLPMIVKPTDAGSSIGVSKVTEQSDLRQSLESAFQYSSQALVEEHISGKELQCGVLGNSSGGDLVPLPVTEIRYDAPIFDYESKYSENGAEEITPAPISDGERDMVQHAAVTAHRCLGCDGLSRVDTILRNGEVYVLEVNTIPGMTEQSLCPQQAVAAGLGFPGLLDRMVALALAKAGKLSTLPA